MGAAPHLAADEMYVLQDRALRTPEESRAVVVARDGQIVDAVSVAVVFAPESRVFAKTVERRTLRHLDIGRLLVEAGRRYRAQIRLGRHRLAEHRPDGRLVEVGIFRRQAFPAYERAAEVWRRRELACLGIVARGAGSVAARADINDILREAVEDGRRAQNGRIRVADAKPFAVGDVIALPPHARIAIGDDRHTVILVADDAADMSMDSESSNRAGRIALDDDGVAVGLSADTADALFLCVGGYGAKAAATYDAVAAGGRSITEDAASLIAVCRHLEIGRHVLDQIAAVQLADNATHAIAPFNFAAPQRKILHRRVDKEPEEAHIVSPRISNADIAYLVSVTVEDATELVNRVPR